MTVKELIEALSKLPPDAPVMYVDHEDGYTDVDGHEVHDVVRREWKHPSGQPYHYHEQYAIGRYDHLHVTPISVVVLK